MGILTENDFEKTPVLKDIRDAKEVCWINPKFTDFTTAKAACDVTEADVEDAEERLKRCAPLIMECFPETKEAGGIIESPLKAVPKLQKLLGAKYGICEGKLLLKMDSHLAIAGSVKARGGIYEVLKHTEDLAIEAGIISGYEDDYTKIVSPKAREFFSKKLMQVGSTGNLGMSIGIMSAAIGYKAIVHMSADAKQWKKDLLRSRGVTVIEYEGDYGEAVKTGRKQSDENPDSYFVDDENSKNLFVGYAVSARRLKKQLDDMGIVVDADHPMFAYLPCGVGGAPGGIGYGLKLVFGDAVHFFFVEPTQAPCMLLGLASGKHSGICVQDVGLTGKTHADGLAVGRPSGFVGKVMEPMMSGEFTLDDWRIYDYMRDLQESENIFIEPSSAAAFQGPIFMKNAPSMQEYLKKHGLEDKLSDSIHIAWATGGNLVPPEVRSEFAKTYLK
ncbi:MAG: D-serine ammonia-lyase [Clostridia bacterium]|nr:D-serine ammonia-lyase [Clostridia bacterium]